MQQLYNVKDYDGAHRFIEAIETEAGTFARVQFVGAALTFDVPFTDCTPYDYNAPKPTGKTLAELCQIAAVVYKLDPARIDRAREIVQAENPAMIAEKADHLLIKSSNPSKSYQVTKGSCTCPDHARGNVCKHRIAAWIYREQHPEPENVRYFDFTYCLDCLCEHWVEKRRHAGDICHGENFNPAKIPNTYRKAINTRQVSVHAYNTPRRSSAQIFAEINL